MLNTARWALALGLPAILLALSACSDDSGPGPTRPDPPRRPGAEEVVALEIVPTVLLNGINQSVTIRAFVVGGADEVRFSLQNQQEEVRLTRTGQSVFPTGDGDRPAAIWETSLRSADLLRSPEIRGRNVQLGGVLLEDGSIATLFAWLDDEDRTVGIVRLADDAQATARVINLRVDRHDLTFMGNPLRGPVPALQALAPLLRRFYELLPDQFTFVTVIGTRRLPGNASGLHLGYRNTTLGIGQPLFDRSDQVDLGSPERLESVIAYPDFSLADLGSSTFSHEVAHRWLVRLTGRGFEHSGSHWPLSDMAGGMMGFGIPLTSGRLQFRIDPVAAGRYRFVSQPQAQRFNAVELYLMGLLPASEVTEEMRLFLFSSPASIPVPQEGAEFTATQEPFTIDSVIARAGPRQPGAADAPKRFHVATVVMSFGRLLDRSEMAFFDLLAQRGEARGPLPPVATNLDGGLPQVLPFFDATGGRGEIVTVLGQPPSASRRSRWPR